MLKAVNEVIYHHRIDMQISRHDKSYWQNVVSDVVYFSVSALLHRD